VRYAEPSPILRASLRADSPTQWDERIRP